MSTPPDSPVSSDKPSALPACQQLALPLELDTLPEGGFGGNWERRAAASTNNLCRAFNNQICCDVTIIAGDYTFGAHAVLLLQSDVLNATINGPFHEGQSKTVDLTSDGEEAAIGLIRFLYSGEYISHTLASDSEMCARLTKLNTEERTSAGRVIPFHPALKRTTFHASMWIIGDKYNLPELKRLAQENAEYMLTNYKSIAHLIYLIPLVYETTTSRNRGLRDFILKTISEKQALVLTDNEDKEHLEEALDAVPEFASELAMRLMRGKHHEDEC